MFLFARSLDITQAENAGRSRKTVWPKIPNPSCALRLRPPVICISAARARPCSTGSMPSDTAAPLLLRIEDTDRERSTPEAVEAILKGMEWLGLAWDGQTVYQFARVDRHREVAEQLLAQGKAYRCYATAAELDEMRAKQRAEGKPIRYDGRWRDRDPVGGAGRRAFRHPAKGAARLGKPSCTTRCRAMCALPTTSWTT